MKYGCSAVRQLTVNLLALLVRPVQKRVWILMEMLEKGAVRHAALRRKRKSSLCF